MYRQQGRFWDLEGLLASSQHHYTPQDRKLIYIHTLQSYMDHGLYDKAIYLSRQLEVEGLAFEFPEYHGMMKSFGDAFVTQQYQIVSCSFSCFPSIF